MSSNNNNKERDCESQGLNEIKQEVNEIESEELLFPINTLQILQQINDKRTSEQKKYRRLPWCLFSICLLQIILYAVGNDLIQLRLIFIYERRHEYWRYITYMLCHADLTHLMLNLILQCTIGFILEMEQGHWKIVIMFFSGGICGSMATSILQPQLSLLGASAGVYAMLISHVPHLIKNFMKLTYRYMRIIALSLLCLSDVAFTTFHFHVNKNRNPRISLEAHIAGAICGLCLGLLIYDNKSYSSIRVSFHEP